MPVIIGHACWPIATATNILLAECRWKKDGYSFRCDITSDMSADPVPLSDMHACTVQLYQTCMLGSFIDTRVCIVLLYQARHLVCHKSIRHVYRQGAAATGLKKNLLATILDAILNI